MRVVLDTNVLISALMTRGTPPDMLYEAWRERRFQVVSCERQIEEIKRVSKRPFFRKRLKRSEVGRLVRDLRRLTILIEVAACLAFTRSGRRLPVGARPGQQC